MGVIYKNEAERTDLQSDIPSSTFSIHDLRELYYKNELNLQGGADRQETELVRSFLQSKTGATNIQSLYDLWVLYLVNVEGIAQRPSLGDMLKEFFSGPVAGNPPLVSGQLMGFPFPMTYS